MIEATLNKSKSLTQHGQFHQQSSTCRLEQTSNFLKHEVHNPIKKIGDIVKNEIKAFHLRKRLEAQVDHYNKDQQNKKMRVMAEDRIHEFRQNEKSLRRKQCDIFQDKQKERQQKLNRFLSSKEESHRCRYSQANKTIRNVRQRYLNITSEDSKNRLSRLPENSYGKSSEKMSRILSSKILSNSQMNSRVDIVQKMQGDNQNHKITNYLNKIQKSQSRILIKEIDFGKRRETGLRKKVKCLINLRKKNEQNIMDRVERQYQDRMHNFASNFQRISQSKELMLMNRGMMNIKVTQRIVENRKKLHQEEIDKIVTNYNNKGGKQNLMAKYRSQLDLSYTSKNKATNLTKMRKENQQTHFQHNMRLLINKIKKIKDLNDDEKLDQRSIKVILSMMDKNDPQYTKMADFLNNQKRVFIEEIAKRQEQKLKMKKMNRSLSKTSQV